MTNIDQKLSDLQRVCETWPPEALWLVKYIRYGEFAKMMDVSLRGDRHRIDRFVDGLKAVPRGTVLHWLSGNVPVLSVLSALMSVMSDNETFLKLSSHDDGLTRACLDTLNADIMYVESDEAELVSAKVDVRVAWGGREAVDAITRLPHKWDCQDIVFGTKLSLALIDEQSKTCDVARKVAVDVASLDQMGCNSCQTVVVEGDGSFFAEMIAAELDRMGGAPFNAERWGKICQDRCEHHRGYMFENDLRVIGPMAPRYTVLYNNAMYSHGVPTDVAMGRTLYVLTIDKLENVVIPEGTQTVGVTRQVSTLCVDRVVPVGEMTNFTVPWDGVFPMERMIRWVSCQI